MKIVSIFLVAVFFVNTGWGQEKLKNNSPQMQFSLDGMIGASFGKNFYTLNIGGPVLFLNLHKDFKVGVGLLPSIYSENPFFPSQPFGKWVGSVGIGYKFQKKAK